MINTYDEIFEHNFCIKLYQDALTTIRSGRPVFTTNYFWSDQLIRSSAPVLITDLDKNIVDEVFEALIKKGVINDADGFQCLCYAWTRGSYISWHNDGAHDVAITVYLNPDWELDWGGLFLYEEAKNSIKAIPPKFNTAVKNTNEVLHAVSAITNDALVRVTLQIFKPKKKD